MQDLVLLPNATTGLNVVIQSCGLGPGDVVYMLDIGYGSVKKMAQAAVARGATAAAGAGAGAGGETEAAGGPEVVMGQVRFPIRCARERRGGKCSSDGGTLASLHMNKSSGIEDL